MQSRETEHCRELAQAVGRIFHNGLALGEDARHYLEAVVGCGDLSEIPAILSDESHPEQASLLELVYFPDLSARLELEPLLGRHSFSLEEVPEIADRVVQIAPRTRLLAESGSLEIETFRAGAELFIARIHPQRTPDAEVAGILDQHLPASPALRCRVHLRSCRETFTDPARRLLADFIPQFAGEADFEDGLLHLLRLAPQIPIGSDPVSALLSRRFQLESALDRARQQDRDLRSHAVETLLTQRASLLSIDREAVRAEMDWVDRILVRTYQVMPTPKSGPEISLDSDDFQEDPDRLHDFFSRF